jgi:hypothetical protein
MKIIVPTLIDDTTLTATDVPETDNPDWALSQSYSVGNQRQITTPNVHTLYECVQAHTSDANNKPTVDVDPNTGIGAYWIRVSATNTWAMFSDQISDRTEQATSITVTITPGEVINGIALFNLAGIEVQVQMDDPIDGIVYDTTVSLNSNEGINDWYEYYFNPIETKSDIALLDLPAYSTADVIVTINAPAGTAACGLLTLGYQRVLGIAENGSGVGILDYSRKELDAYGRPIVVQRGYSKIASYDVHVQTNRISYIQNLLANLRTTPVTWIGSEEYGATIVYGYYRDFDLVFRDPVSSPATIEVEGLT